MPGTSVYRNTPAKTYLANCIFDCHCPMPARERTLASSQSTITTDQLRWRYIVALSLIALLTVFSQGVMQFLLSDQEYDSRVINIAGRQRMLSQKIAKTSFYVATTESTESVGILRQQLAELLTLWERSHSGLLRGDADLGLLGRNSVEVMGLFKRIEPHHQAIVTATRHLLAAAERSESITFDIQQIREHETQFLQGMDEIVFRYDLEAKRKVAVARWLELVLMALTLLVLALEARFIFAPVTHRIRDDMQALEEKEEDMSQLFSASPTAMLMVDSKDLAIIEVNQKASDLIGLPIQTITGSCLRDYFDATYATSLLFLESLARHPSINNNEVVLLDMQHAIINVLVSVREITYEGREVLVLGITNISELKEAQLSLEHYATFDEMTGLVNRRAGLLVLENSMARSRRDGRQLAIAFADIDGLKTTNDRFGHADGDWLIRTCAKAFTDSIRAGDIATRLGGDEFLLIFHDCSMEEASGLISRIEHRLADIGAREYKPYPISISYGLAAFDATRHAKSEDLVAEADALMYRVKQERKRRA